MRTTQGNQALSGPARDRVRRLRPSRLIILFGLAGLACLGLEFALGKQMPSAVWFCVLALALLAWPTMTSPYETTGLEDKVAVAQRPEVQAMISTSAEPPALEAPSGAAVVLSIVSHEIRTPINAIVGFSELLRNAERQGAGAKTREGYAAQVLASAAQLRQVVDDVLDANRLASNGVVLLQQECHMAELVEAAIHSHAAAADERGVSIVANLADAIVVQGDSHRLRRAVGCLIANAIAFSPSDGFVNVSMMRGRQGQLVLAVTDAGAGLRQQDVERAFQPFSQIDEGLSRQHGGLGLGLFISRQIARLHGGDLLLLPQAGVGTEARLVLPAERVMWSAAPERAGHQVA